jgi:DNA repair protein RecO (recombination protein O)
MQGLKEYKGLAIVLSRTNYGEADRIVRFLTPVGVISAVARGVRREKSKLRGGAEPFALNEVSIIAGKSELGILRSARAVHLYEKIIYDFAAMEVAAEVIKMIQKLTRDHDDPNNFAILEAVLTELERTQNYQAVLLWAYLRLTASVGVQLNLATDVLGEPLAVEVEYDYDAHEHAFRAVAEGVFDARHIKLLRLVMVVDLAVFLRVENVAELLPVCMDYARAQLQQ